MKIKLDKKPYENGTKIYKKPEVEIEEGITILVGCNGYEKTTFLSYVEKSLRESKLPFLKYDNVVNGSRSKGTFLDSGAYDMFFTHSTSSEGECIILNLGDMIKRINIFVGSNGEDKDIYESEKFATRFSKAVRSLNPTNEEQKENKINKEYFVLFDACDSGLSIDMMEDFNFVLNRMYKDFKEKGITLYFIVSTNSYELTEGNKCLDVCYGKYVEFKTYNSFKKFVMKTRKIKELREEKAKK